MSNNTKVLNWGNKPSCRRGSKWTLGSSKSAGKSHWNGLLTWTNACPNCPLLNFTSDFSQISQESSEENISDSSWNNSQADARKVEERQQMMLKARHLVDNHHVAQAFSVLVELAKRVSYKLNEDELALLIKTAEIVVRSNLSNACQMTMRDISHAIGFVKANIRRVSLASHSNNTGADVNEEKINFRNLLLSLVDIIQSIRHQMLAEYVSIDCESNAAADASDSIASASKSIDTEKLCHEERYNLYLTFFSLLIQSAFLEAGLVSGSVYQNRLVGNAEEAYYLTNDCKDEKLAFLKPLGAYIYGRLWCETGENESHGAYFLSEFYDKHGTDFETMLETCSKEELHSTYLCNMRRIRETVHKYQHLL